MFVPIIENNQKEELNIYFEKYLEDLKHCDLIVLGCTHYPLIKEELSKYLNIKLLDMSECIDNMTNEGESKVELYFSKLDDNIINNVKNILNANDYLKKNFY